MSATATESEFDYVESSGWKPKKGEVIEGTVQDISEGYSTYKNEGYPILTIEKADGSAVDVHCFHEVLRNKILQFRPQVGTKIGIKFLGKTKKKGSNSEEVANYIVRVKGGAQADPYARMIGEVIPTPASPPEHVDDEDIPL